jgi:hypothetical protein
MTQVVIVGGADSQWKAQYYIYEKIRQERFATDENVKLRAELQVPAHIVGRIIGKSGKNVRELQRNTGATIKLPEDAALAQQPGQEGAGDEQSEAAETAGGEEAAVGEGEAAVAGAESVAEVGVEGAAEAKAESELAASAQQQAQLNAAGLVVVRIFGTFQASQLAQRRIQALVVQSVRGYNPMENQMVMTHRNSLNNITNHQVCDVPSFCCAFRLEVHRVESENFTVKFTFILLQ